MIRTLFSFSFVAIAACSPYAPELGPKPFLCDLAAPVCPDGYTCMDDGTGTSACIVNGPGGSTVDAPSTAFACADDTVLEGATRNDTIANSSTTPVDTSKKISYSGLAICPAGDKDTYRIDISRPNENLKATVIYDPIAAGGVSLSVSILNSTGISIANGAPSGENTVIANVPNLAIATSPYYVQVYGPPTGENNYKLQLEITP